MASWLDDALAPDPAPSYDLDPDPSPDPIPEAGLDPALMPDPEPTPTPGPTPIPAPLLPTPQPESGFKSPVGPWFLARWSQEMAPLNYFKTAIPSWRVNDARGAEIDPVLIGTNGYPISIPSGASKVSTAFFFDISDAAEGDYIAEIIGDATIDDFVGHFNHRRYHESLKNLTPADVYFGRGQTILLEREKIKQALVSSTCSLSI